MEHVPSSLWMRPCFRFIILTTGAISVNLSKCGMRWWRNYFRIQSGLIGREAVSLSKSTAPAPPLSFSLCPLSRRCVCRKREKNQDRWDISFRPSKVPDSPLGLSGNPMRFQYVIKYEKNLELRATKMGDFECPCRGQTPIQEFFHMSRFCSS